MKLSKKARKTMPESWQQLFDYADKMHWSKYFEDDGNQCCAYAPESNSRREVQTAKRRSWGKTAPYLREGQRKAAKKIFGYENYVLNIFYLTCAPLHGGVYIYDKALVESKGLLKREKWAWRNKRPYYVIPLQYCFKTMDLWDVPKNYGWETLFKIVRWQYQYMLRHKDPDGKTPYSKVKGDDWTTLPNYCLWKFMEVDGTVIPGREEAFNEYVSWCKNHANFIHRYDEEVKDDE